MGNVKDFKGFKVPGNVPIIGQTPSNVRDALGRILHPGDLVILQTPTAQPFRLTKIEPGPPNEPNGLMVHFEAHAIFLAPKNGPNNEFLRIAAVAETKAGVPVEPEKAQEIADAVEAAESVAAPEPSSE